MLDKVKKAFSRLTKDGSEISNKGPRAINVNMKAPRQLSLNEQIANLLKKQQFQNDVRNQGFETFEEANDFDTDEDLNDPFTKQPYRYEDEDEERVNKNLKDADEEIKAKKTKKVDQSTDKEKVTTT